MRTSRADLQEAPAWHCSGRYCTVPESAGEASCCRYCIVPEAAGTASCQRLNSSDVHAGPAQAASHGHSKPAEGVPYHPVPPFQQGVPYQPSRDPHTEALTYTCKGWVYAVIPGAESCVTFVAHRGVRVCAGKRLLFCCGRLA